MHQLILPGYRSIDHRDLNGLNNTRDNLRPASDSQQAANRQKARSQFTSSFKGVHRARLRWVSVIIHNGKYISIGRFQEECDAALAYNLVAEELFGEFAKVRIYLRNPC